MKYLYETVAWAPAQAGWNKGRLAFYERDGHRFLAFWLDSPSPSTGCVPLPFISQRVDMLVPGRPDLYVLPPDTAYVAIAGQPTRGQAHVEGMVDLAQFAVPSVVAIELAAVVERA